MSGFCLWWFVLSTAVTLAWKRVWRWYECIRNSGVARVVTHIRWCKFRTLCRLQRSQRQYSAVKSDRHYITVHSDLVASTDDVIRQSSDSTIIVQLLPKGNSFRAELFVKPLGAALPYCKPGMGIRTVVGQSDGKSIQATRDYSRENENLLMAEELCIECD